MILAECLRNILYAQVNYAYYGGRIIIENCFTYHAVRMKFVMVGMYRNG